MFATSRISAVILISRVNSANPDISRNLCLAIGFFFQISDCGSSLLCCWTSSVIFPCSCTWCYGLTISVHECPIKGYIEAVSSRGGVHGYFMLLGWPLLTVWLLSFLWRCWWLSNYVHRRIITLATSSRKRNVTTWRPSVRLSVCPIYILIMTHQGAAFHAAILHFGQTVSRTDIFQPCTNCIPLLAAAALHCFTGTSAIMVVS